MLQLYIRRYITVTKSFEYLNTPHPRSPRSVSVEFERLNFVYIFTKLYQNNVLRLIIKLPVDIIAPCRAKIYVVYKILISSKIKPQYFT